MVINYLKFASKTNVLIVSGLLMLLFILVVFPHMPIVEGKYIDLLRSYSYKEVTALIGSYGEKGRHLYAILSPTLDTLFPIIYVTFYAILVYRLTPRPWQLTFVPFSLGFIDLCENAHIVTKLLQYPDISPKLAASASLFTFIKH